MDDIKELKEDSSYYLIYVRHKSVEELLLEKKVRYFPLNLRFRSRMKRLCKNKMNVLVVLKKLITKSFNIKESPLGIE